MPTSMEHPLGTGTSLGRNMYDKQEEVDLRVAKYNSENGDIGNPESFDQVLVLDCSYHSSYSIYKPNYTLF